MAYQSSVITKFVEECEIIDDVPPMILSKLLKGVTVIKLFQTVYGNMVVTHEVEVQRLQYDSRKVGLGDLFVAIRGSDVDGHNYIHEAVNNGAKVIVVQDDVAMHDSFFMHTGVVKVVVPNSRIALAQIASNYYGNPSSKLRMIGVTGTNGKTTTTHLVKSIVEASGEHAGLIGTIEYKIGDEVILATHTTPESLELNELLARMVEHGCSSAVMEVSSHALHQHRVHGIHFNNAVFTNLTQDHLDYHGSMEEYFKAKKTLFDSLDSSAWAIVNTDDEWGKQIYDSVGCNKIAFGMNASAEVRAQNVACSLSGLQFTILHACEETPIQSPLVGRFNVSNILGAFSVGIAMGIPKSTLHKALQNAKTVQGRFEPIVSPQGWTAIVDYAHSPDALQKVLMAVRELITINKAGRIITTFGCGGNRDKAKRPIMGRIAEELSDIVVVTSDNPRYEHPETIINEVMKGMKAHGNVHREGDRRTAIYKALGFAHKGDVILIAGKGHEEYQVIGDRKIHFSDREVVEEFIQSHVGNHSFGT
ncbi:MAG: UDP-N-acetylmuramoyl-L-alanyl-D-glutamate--2,6-diaminopimelate ligase [Ignavibacteriae bacterium]|nr:UDP-N-acetylmuramoyl-L-alanyl-D-glutamate--2,6-diaminopimelate ligase [Ignavibacteriota bacterium]